MKRIEIRLFLVATLALLASCGPASRSSVKITLDEVETYINDRPDSALAVLRGMDNKVVRGRALRARAALLHSMALDKCYIDLQTDSILAPAISWYERHGMPDEKLKLYFYQGRLFQNQQILEKTVSAFARAEEQADKANDPRVRGLLYSAQSVLFRDAFNSDKEIEYILKGLSCYEMSGDSVNIRRTDARLAMAYHRKKDWTKADSLFIRGIPLIRSDTVYYAAVLSDYARMKVLQPDPDPTGAVRALIEKHQQYHKSFKPDDFGVYAYALTLSGEDATPYVNYLKTISGPGYKDAQYWLYRIEAQTGNYADAIEAMNNAYAAQLDIYERTLNASVSRALLHEQEAQTREMKRQLSRSHFLIMTFAVFFLLLVMVLLLLRRKCQLQEEIVSREREYKIEQYANMVEELRSRLAIAIGENHSAMDLGFDTLDRLCDSYYTSGHKKSEKLLQAFEILVFRFRKDKEYLHSFQDRVDTLHGGILTLMKTQLTDFSDEDYLLLSLVISGLSYNSISVILDTNKSNVYNRVSRIRRRIENTEAEDKALFLDALRKNPAFGCGIGER